MSQYKDIIIPSGTLFNNARITGNGRVSFKHKINQFDVGDHIAALGSYKILSVVDRSKEDTAPFSKAMEINGFSVKIGTIVNIQLTNDTTVSAPTEAIIFDGGDWSNGFKNIPNNNPPINTTNNSIINIEMLDKIKNNAETTANTINKNSEKKSVFTSKNIIIGLLAIGVIVGGLKLAKVF